VTDWGTLVVAKMSPWLQTDSSIETVRRNSEMVRVKSSQSNILFTCGDCVSVSAV